MNKPTDDNLTTALDHAASDRLLSTESSAYLNARAYYASVTLKARSRSQDRILWGDTADYDSSIVEPFQTWLAEQGGTIVRCRSEDRVYGIDSYNVAVGTDMIEFHRQNDMLLFVLKWSCDSTKVD